MNWYVGQKIVCVNAGRLNPSTNNSPPLRKDGVYIICAINTCKTCGDVKLDVGLSSDNMVICVCGSNTQDSIWWCASQRFRPLQTKTCTREEGAFTLEEMLELAKIENLQAV